MEKTANISAQGMVRDLVNQFSDTLAFYRELIQNSIDAGSNRIDVSLDYAPDPDGGRGLAVVRVEDDGGGMDENILDNYLLVLFKSTKENDLTKIGKFGVGFLSVFALKPELVRVYTAKNLESWRLDFPDFRSYSKYRMPDPRDGTLVEIHKRMSREEYAALCENSLATVRYWCRHADIRIFFTDRAANQPPLQVNEVFTLPGGESLRYSEEGTEVVMGFSPEEAFAGTSAEPAKKMRDGCHGDGARSGGEPFYGFYNRGLTLKEGKKLFIPGVEFKIKSRYLEHTITRDNVMEDANYHKAMAIIKRQAAKELPKKLRAELEALALRLSKPEAQADPAELRALEYEWWRRRTFFRFLRDSFLAGFRHDFEEWRVIPTVTGTPATAEELKEAWKKECRTASDAYYFVARKACPVTRALGAMGVPVTFATENCSFSSHLPMGAVNIEKYLLAEAVRPAGPGVGAFLKTLSLVGSACGRDYSVFYPARFTYGGEPPEQQPFLFRKAPYGPGHVDEGQFLKARARLYPVVNCFHPFITGLAELHVSRPGFAAFLLLKSMLLHQDGSVSPYAEADSSNLTGRRERKLLRAALKLDGGGEWLSPSPA